MSTTASAEADQLTPRNRDWSGLASVFAVDTRALSVVRILLGGLIVYQSLFLDWSQPRAPAGLLDTVTAYSHIIVLPFAVMLLLGFKTRLAVIVSWLVYSLPIRSTLLAGFEVPMGYIILNLALFWCMFLPLDRHLALDSRTRHRAPVRFLSVASGALLFQIFIIYFSAGVVKHPVEWVIDATAMQSILAHPRYETALGVALLSYPTVLAAMSIATYFLEILGSLLVLLPRKGLAQRRLVLVPVFIVFHFGIAVFMGLAMFPHVMIALWLLYLPSSFWDRLWQRLNLVTASPEPFVDTSRWRNRLALGAVAIAAVSNAITWAFYPRYGNMPVVFDWFQDFAIVLTLYQRWLMFNVPSLMPM
jgi:hypothetical protein